MSIRSLLISDIHNRIDWIEPYLEKYKKDFKNVVFLGDEFDRFHDSPDQTEKTARWVKYSINQPNRIHILGNHNMPYMVPNNPSQDCPGFTKAKCKIINDVLKPEDWAKFVPAVEVQGWLVSHAGAHPTIFAPPLLDSEYPSVQNIIDQANKALYKVKMGGNPPEFAWGRRMLNTSGFGGITWADWDMEFWPFPRVNQIVGHTPGGYPRKKEGSDSLNYCIDCACQVLCFITDGHVTFEMNPLRKQVK